MSEELPPSTATSDLFALYHQVRRRIVGDGVGAALAHGAVRTTILTVAGAGISFFVQILLARALGHNPYGAYQYALATMNAVLLLAKLEVDTAGVRFIGAYTAKQRWDLLRGFMRESRYAMTLTSIVAAAGGAVAVHLGRGWLEQKDPGLPAAMYVACVLLPLTARLMADAAFLQGFQRYLPAQFAPNVMRPALLGLSVAATWAFLRHPLPAYAAVVANTGASLVALAFTAVVLRRATPPAVRNAPIAHDRPDWVRTTTPLLLISLAQLIISQQADLIVVGSIINTYDAGTYSAASQFTIPLSIVVNSVTFVAQTMIAALYAKGDIRGLQQLIRAVTRANAVVAVPIVVALIVLGKPLLGLYGPSFTAGYPVLIILAVSQLVIALIGSLAGYLLTMTEHQNAAAWIIGGASLLNLVLTLILTPRYGLVGTASATLIASLSRSIALSIFIRRRMGLTVPAF